MWLSIILMLIDGKFRDATAIASRLLGMPFRICCICWMRRDLGANYTANELGTATQAETNNFLNFKKEKKI